MFDQILQILNGLINAFLPRRWKFEKGKTTTS
jgi:hypothetical protein